MTTLITRSGKGSPLSWLEADSNIINLSATIDANYISLNDSITSNYTTLNTNKAPINSPTFTGTVGGITKTMVGLSNVDNTSDTTKDSATSTLTNKTITSPKIKAGQFGDSSTATNNFTITAEAVDGTMKLARGNAGATTQDIMTVDADGKVAFQHEDIVGFLGTFSGSGISTSGLIAFTETRDDGGCYTSGQFKPTVAGWYSVSCSAEFSITSMSYCGVDIKKNGAIIRRQIQGPYNGTAGNACVTAEVYLNGSSDYVEFHYLASPTGGSLSANTFASGALLRKA